MREDYTNCNDCYWEDCTKCGRLKPVNSCDYFFPTDQEKYTNNLIQKLRERNIPSLEKKLRRRAIKSNNVFNDGVDSLDSYYVSMINDSLKQIRSGDTAYLYSIEQLKDVLRFEPNIKIHYMDGIFHISPEIKQQT